MAIDLAGYAVTPGGNTGGDPAIASAGQHSEDDCESASADQRRWALRAVAERAAAAAAVYFTRTSLRSASRWATRRMKLRIWG